MSTIILDLDDPRADLDAVGGKGMSLAKMLRVGLPVPGGFHITTAAYRCFVTANALQPQILAALATTSATDQSSLEAASQAIRQLFAASQIPDEMAGSITSAYAALEEAPVAVRSSATAEDLPGASFAGQQDTYLNIHGPTALLDAVKKCWCSLWTARAIAYRLNNNIDQATVALAVVVQKLVFADAAGVLFTANPLNGSRDELVINAAWGLGEAVVSGLVTPDTLVVRKQPFRILRRTTANKQVMTIRTQDGTQDVVVPAPQMKKAVLNAAQTAELTRLGLKIEQFYAMPMDVEWALAGGKFAILQARPITALPMEWKLPDPGAVYSRGSLAEHIPSPVTPLFATLGLHLANTATAEMWERMVGADALKLFPEEGFYQVINGYVYGGMNMSGKNMFYVIKISLSLAAPMFRGSVARWRSARQNFAEVVEAWQRRPFEELSSPKLWEGASTLFAAACRYFTDIQTTLPAASSSETLFTSLYNSLIRRKGDPQSSVFLLGFETTALCAEKSLYDLSQWLKTHPPLDSYILQTPTEKLLAQLQNAQGLEGLPADQWAEWQQRFQRHLDQFGRTAYDFDFSNPTPCEAPGPLLDAIKMFLGDSAHNPYERQRQAVAKREDATRAVLKRVGWPRKAWFEKLLRWAQDTAPMREDAIYDMGMAHPTLRRMFNEMGRRLAAAGAIAQAEDIYWLEKQEVAAAVAAFENGAPASNLAARITERKAQSSTFLKANPPVMLPEKSGWSKIIGGADTKEKDGKIVLKGVGTSSGKISAPACVLFGPEDFSKLHPGDVLVAVTTTPAWTPLFALASAVVTDIGGPLSHSSIVAREYGIPAVMAARTATRAIHNGQLITVDGSSGTVTIH